MYDTLSTAEKIELLKHYKSAYPKMNYRSVVNHFNEGLKQYGDGGLLNESAS